MDRQSGYERGSDLGFSSSPRWGPWILPGVGASDSTRPPSILSEGQGSLGLRGGKSRGRCQELTLPGKSLHLWVPLPSPAPQRESLHTDERRWKVLAAGAWKG